MTGFVFDAGIRDAEENRELENMNGLYRAYDPSAWKDMTLTTINAPIRIGRATVLPGDLVLAKKEGVIFIPAYLAEDAVSHAEFINLEDAFNFDLNRRARMAASSRAAGPLPNMTPCRHGRSQLRDASRCPPRNSIRFWRTARRGIPERHRKRRVGR